MKMICDVPDEVIKCIKDGTWCGSSVAEKMIANGIPLSSSENPNKSEIMTGWIPVSERLPNFAGTYLVTRYFPNNVMNPTYLVDACFFDGTDTWHNDNRINHERKYLTNVVAWLEEPEPYKAEGSDKE